MIGFRLGKYVAMARANGVSDERIEKELLQAGWGKKKVEKALSKHKPETIISPSGEIIPVPQKANKSLVYFVIFVVSMLATVAAVTFFWGSKVTPAQGSNNFVKDYLVNPINNAVDSFTATSTTSNEVANVIDTKEKYINEKVDFVEADLDAKIVHLYQGGIEIKSYPILAFGRDGSWWETPTGDYTVLGKETKHFSSIGKVWMPWSMNFYGNFFIHGWPYYDGGEPVEPGHSGGCIRLSTDDAKDLYQYVSKGTPVLVRESTLLSKFGSFIMPSTHAPEVSATSFLVSNLSTGEILAKKNNDAVVADAPIAKLMTAVLATELIYIERSLPVDNSMIVSAPSLFEPKDGEEYVAFDLFYPLLMQSSDTAANIIASSLGSRYFIDVMNKKAVSLGMYTTHFESTQNLESNNTATLNDMFKLLQYTYFKRAFLLRVSKGFPYTIYSGEHSTALTNLNQLVDDKRLVGMQERETVEGQSALSVWEITTPSGPVPVSIILIGSKNATEDTQAVIDWIDKNAILK